MEVISITKAGLGGLTGQTLHYVSYITPDGNIKKRYDDPLHLRRYRSKSGGSNGGLCFKYRDDDLAMKTPRNKSSMFALPSFSRKKESPEGA